MVLKNIALFVSMNPYKCPIYDAHPKACLVNIRTNRRIQITDLTTANTEVIPGLIILWCFKKRLPYEYNEKS
jgi:hypothetical protein